MYHADKTYYPGRYDARGRCMGSSVGRVVMPRISNLPRCVFPHSFYPVTMNVSDPPTGTLKLHEQTFTGAVSLP